MLVAGASLSWSRDDSACTSKERCTRCGQPSPAPATQEAANHGCCYHATCARPAVGGRGRHGLLRGRAWPRRRRWHACTTGTPLVERPSARRDVGGLVEPFAFGGAAALAGLGNATQCAPMRQPRAGGWGGLRFVECCAVLRIICYYMMLMLMMMIIPLGLLWVCLCSDEQRWWGGSVLLTG